MDMRSMTPGRNDCPNPACDRTKPRGKAFCLPCWRRVPRNVQDQVYASYQAYDLLAHVDFLDRLGARLAAGVGEWPTPTQPRACRVCGCTEFDACPGSCWWVEDDLCSACEARLDDETDDREEEPIR